MITRKPLDLPATARECTKCANGIGHFVPTFIIARRNAAIETPLVMARSLRMTLERRKTAGLDDKLATASLEKLMSEVISLREKVAQAELQQGHYYTAPFDATKHGRQSFSDPNP